MRREACDDSERLGIPLETISSAMVPRQLVEFLFGRMSERWVAEVVRQASRFCHVRVDAAEPLHFSRVEPQKALCQPSCDLRNLEGVS